VAGELARISDADGGVQRPNIAEQDRLEILLPSPRTRVVVKDERQSRSSNRRGRAPCKRGGSLLGPPLEQADIPAEWLKTLGQKKYLTEEEKKRSRRGAGTSSWQDLAQRLL